MAAGKRRGFTLIELLVVVAVIAILMGLLISGVMIGRAKAQRGMAQEALRQITIAIVSYRDHFGSYPMPETKFGNPGSDPMAGSQALAYFLCTKFKEGDHSAGPFLDWPASGFEPGPKNQPALVSPIKNKYLYSNVWENDGKIHSFVVIDAGLDHQFGGSIQPGTSTTPTPVPAWLPDGTGRDVDNIERPN